MCSVRYIRSGSTTIVEDAVDDGLTTGTTTIGSGLCTTTARRPRLRSHRCVRHATRYRSSPLHSRAHQWNALQAVRAYSVLSMLGERRLGCPTSLVFETRPSEYDRPLQIPPSPVERRCQATSGTSGPWATNGDDGEARTLRVHSQQHHWAVCHFSAPSEVGPPTAPERVLVARLPRADAGRA